jgi:hypothetical protein
VARLAPPLLTLDSLPHRRDREPSGRLTEPSSNQGIQVDPTDGSEHTDIIP